MSNYNGGVHNRRKRALARLEENKAKYVRTIQLAKNGSKDLKKFHPDLGKEDLEEMRIIYKNGIEYGEEAIIRIDKEIATLKSRIDGTTTRRPYVRGISVIPEGLQRNVQKIPQYILLNNISRILRFSSQMEIWNGIRIFTV